jgi:hypothetical protein
LSTAVTGLPAPRPAWGAAAFAAAAAALGLRPEENSLHAALLQLWQTHLAPRSITGYNAKLRLYLQFCSEQHLPAFPCSPTSLALYVTWLHQRGTIQPSCFRQYISVVATAHRDLLLPPPHLPMLPALIRAAQRAHTAAAPGGVVRAHRGPLPASVAVRALAAATAPGAPFRFCWAALAVLLAFHTGLRGASILSLSRDCFVLHSDGMGYDVLVSDEKGRAHLGVRRCIPCRSLYPELVTLLSAALTLASAALPATAPLFSSFGAATDGTFGRMVQLVLEHLGAAPPAGTAWLGHSCRSGMASACAALGVPIRPTLCERGGWHSDAVYQYVFSHIQADWPAFVFFAFLLPVGLRNATAAAFPPLPLAAFR